MVINYVLLVIIHFSQVRKFLSLKMEEPTQLKLNYHKRSILKAVDKKAHNWPNTKWNKVYNNTTEKYANVIFPQKGETFNDTKHRKPNGSWVQLKNILL